MTQPGNLADKGALGMALEACSTLDEDAERWLVTGTILARVGDEARARAAFERVIEADDGDGRLTLHALLGMAASHSRMGERGTALDYLKIALKLEPEDRLAAHLKATLGNSGTDTPLHGEVSSLFDDYAAFYDLHIVNTLRYRGPELISKALRACLGPQGHLPLVIDLGCGTGLCGPPVRDLTDALVGIDLSAEMVAKSRDVAAYDAVWQDDAMHALRTFQSGGVGAIVAGDVVGYIRALPALLGEARRVLRDDGVWVMCVEAWDGDADVSLSPSRRIRFSEAYLRQTATREGFTIVAMTREILRYESAEPVDGWVLTLQPRASAGAA